MLDLDFRFLLLVVWPILVTVLTQLIKVLIKLVQTGKLDPQEYFTWGKFPSSHLALVSSLVTVVALVAGFDSLEFGIALALAVLVARDAVGLRMFVENNAHAINRLRSLLPREKQKLIAVQPLRIGHTKPEAFAGALFGIGTTLILYWLVITL